ncbi:heparinase [Aquirufa nivalisilvae]|uniref:heparinase II/III domain-containing protein n=1 Tax=Aquirufa nivalisilvae TaxID=2516557 RepID=UPI0022A9DEAD|nr:heparinase II/III family protein [Aquirufa nivalisilvae]MCZ2483212.1 heparinase [Aquirufa nivalisilvae]
MKKGFLIYCLLLAQFTWAQEFSTLIPAAQGHPRLLFLKSDEAIIQRNIQQDTLWANLHQQILKEADVLLLKEPLIRKQIGRRLLGVSREMLRRTLFWSYAYRMTKQLKYAQRAEKELLQICQFTDWNPSHFLDVAEMTTAVAIGYDWLFEALSTESKQIIRAAILSKGIEPSYDERYTSWLKASHNWNQVCNAGMSLGILAIQEDYPAKAQELIQRAQKSIILPMKDYGPDGAYPEGYAYWGYGTSFQVLYNDAIEKVYGSDFGLNQLPGFYASANYMLHMTGPSGKNFNYSDSGDGIGFHPAMFWFAAKTQNNSLLFTEINTLKTAKNLVSDRLLPLVMVWGKGASLVNPQLPQELTYLGGGPNPVAMMRSSWTDKNALYVGLKGGSPSVNHGHMDVGSFVFDALGERWAMDFGMQDYESLESKGVAIWGKEQNAQRWDVFRYHNRSHNTLTLNNQLQAVKGKSEVIGIQNSSKRKAFGLDLSSLYQEQASGVHRQVALLNNRSLEISDQIQSIKQGGELVWTMLTTAEFHKEQSGKAYLTQNGKRLNLQIKGVKGEWITWSSEPNHDYDAPNPGTRFVGFKLATQAGQTWKYQVLLAPEN